MTSVFLCLSFCDIASLCIMFSSSTHLPASFKVLFIFTAKEDFIYIGTTFSLFIHQLMDLHIPNFMNTAIVNMDEHVSL